MSVAGPEGAPVVVLLHGVFFDRSIWGPVSELLAVDHRVVALDLPGHGDLANDTFSLRGAARDIESRLAREGLRPRVIVGLSLGGYVAMTLVDRFPATCNSLVITGATREPRAFVGGPLRLLYRGASHMPARPLELAFRVALKLFTHPTVGALLLQSKMSISGGFRALASLPNTGFRAALSRFPGRVLVINGAHDPVAHPGQGAFIEAMRHGELITVENVGHHVPLQRPNEFASAVRLFVRETSD